MIRSLHWDQSVLASVDASSHMYHLKIAIRDADTWRDPGLAEVCEKNLDHGRARTVTVVGGLVAALGTLRFLLIILASA